LKVTGATPNFQRCIDPATTGTAADAPANHPSELYPAFQGEAEPSSVVVAKWTVKNVYVSAENKALLLALAQEFCSLVSRVVQCF